MSNIDLVMQRLAEANPAPADERHRTGPQYSFLFDTIYERSGGMQTTTITPWWHRGPIVAIAVFVLIVGAGATFFALGADHASDVATVMPDPPTTVAFEPIPGVPDRPAIEVVEDMLAAMEAGDGAAMLAYHHPNVVVIPFDGKAFTPTDIPDFQIEDYDGDGNANVADDVLWVTAMRGSWGDHSTWDCREIDEYNVECTITSTNDLAGSGPGIDWVDVESFLVEGGLIVEVRRLTDPADNETAYARWFRQIRAYERWVKQTYPESWADLFDEPCCNSEFRELPETVPVHRELIAEFIASR